MNDAPGRHGADPRHAKSGDRGRSGRSGVGRGDSGGRGELCFGGMGMFADFCNVCMCVAAEVCDCGWSHLWAAGACPFRMLQCPVAAGSLSYGTGAAVCALLLV